MKRWRITPKVQTLPFDPIHGLNARTVAEALIREDDEGGWVHHEDAVAAIKKAVETAGVVSLRQRYKMAAMTGILSAGRDANFSYTGDTSLAIMCGGLADAMLAEDQEHAKK